VYQVQYPAAVRALVGTPSGLTMHFGFCLKAHGDFRINRYPMQLNGATKVSDDF
jgi:hypothetical protein